MNFSRAGSTLARVLVAAVLSCTVAQSRAAAGPTVIEFYNTSLDNYFVTADANEAAGIDAGAAGPGWRRTGGTFSSGGSTPVCRFYGSQSPGPNSHFYTVSASECQTLKNLQFAPNDPRRLTEKSWNFESLDFVSTPPVNDACPAGTVAVYRAYNGGFERGVDSNHRLSASLAAIQEVVSRGWKDEGVRMCAPPEPVPAGKVAVSLDPALPASVAASVKQVSTLFDVGAIGANIDLPTSADGRDGLVLALDADDKLRLAAVEIPADGKLVLSADSTALALVRIAIGSLPSGFTAQALDQIIRATAAYPALVTAVNQALAAGVATSTASPVLAQLAAAAAQAAEQVRATQASSGLKAIPATLPLPFSMLGGAGNLLSMHLIQTTTAGKVDIKNSLPLYWQASANGSGLIDVPPCDLKCLAGGAVSPWLGPDRVQLPDAAGEAFILHLEQNSRTRQLNTINVIRGIISMGFDLLPASGPQCNDSIAKALLASGKLDSLTSPAEFKAYLSGTALKLIEWGKAIRDCAPAAPPGAGAKAGLFVYALAEVVSGAAEVMAAANAGATAVQMSLWFRYFDTTADVKICEAMNPLLPRLVIVNCAVRIAPSPTPVILAPGAKIAQAYKAFDAADGETGLPAALKFTSTDSALVAVDVATGALTAGAKPGTVNVTVASSTIPLSSTFPVAVADPVIVPAAPAVDVGGLITLQLADKSGQLIDARGSGTVWASLDPTIADVTIVSALVPYPNAAVIQGKKAGTTSIYAHNPVSGLNAAVNLVVNDVLPPGPNGNWRFTTTSCTPLSSNPPGCNVSCNPTIDYGLAGNSDLSKINVIYPQGSAQVVIEMAPFVPPSGPPPPRTYSGCWKNSSGGCDPSPGGVLYMEFAANYRTSPSWMWLGFYGACGVDQRGTAAMQ